MWVLEALKGDSKNTRYHFNPPHLISFLNNQILFIELEFVIFPNFTQVIYKIIIYHSYYQHKTYSTIK